MKKPYEYYVEKINKTYPELKKLSIIDYERIASKINAELAAGGTGKIAVKELYNRTLTSFLSLAKFYADNELDHKTFEDDMSILYLELMEYLNRKLDDGHWSKDYNSFYFSVVTFRNNLFKKLAANNSNKYYLTKDNVTKGSLISKTQKRKDDKEFTRVQIDTEKDIDWLETMEDVVATAQPDEVLACKTLKELLHNLLDELTPKEAMVIETAFGLKDDKPKTLAEVGREIGV